MANVTPVLLFTSAEDLATGGAAWSNLASALAEDGASAASGPVGLVAPDPVTSTLRVFGAAIPDPPPPEFTLLGVEALVKGRWLGSTNGTRSVELRAQVGGVLRQNLSAGSLPMNLFGTFFKGGPVETMGLSEADALDPAFGFDLFGSSSSTGFAGNTLEIDAVSWRFHWIAPGGPSGAGRLRRRRRGAWITGALAPA